MRVEWPHEGKAVRFRRKGQFFCFQLLEQEGIDRCTYQLTVVYGRNSGSLRRLERPELPCVITNQRIGPGGRDSELVRVGGCSSCNPLAQLVNFASFDGTNIVWRALGHWWGHLPGLDEFVGEAFLRLAGDIRRPGE